MGIGIFCVVLGMLMVVLGISQKSNEFILFGSILVLSGFIFIGKVIFYKDPDSK